MAGSDRIAARICNLVLFPRTGQCTHSEITSGVSFIPRIIIICTLAFRERFCKD